MEKNKSNLPYSYDFLARQVKESEFAENGLGDH